MGLQDRDYVRRAPPLRFPDLVPRPWWRRIKWTVVLPLAASIIAVLSAAVWLARDALPLFGSSRQAEALRLVDINTATLEQLETLPGIGAARARLIIGHRPYRTVDDLKRINGLPDAVVDDLRPLVIVSDETSDE